MKQVCKVIVTLTMLLNSAFSYATVVATNATYGVFDGSSGVRTLSVGTHGVIDDLNLFITFAKCGEPGIGPTGTACIGQGNSYDREIAFLLTGPDGTSVRIVDFFTYTGQTPGAGRVTIRFDDQAGQVVGGSVTGGTFRPIELLAAFNGRDMFGDYMLRIVDAVSEDPLTFFSASLDVVSPDLPVDVPEPVGWRCWAWGCWGCWGWRVGADGRASDLFC
jgi:hypothetical protein